MFCPCLRFRALSAGSGPLGGKAGAAALLHLIGELAHGFLRDGAPLTSGERGFRLIDCGKDLRASALAFLP